MSAAPAQFTLFEFAFVNKNTFSFNHDGPIPWSIVQLFTPVPELPEDLDLKGKTILVTGGNTGLGYEMASKIIKRGGKVVIGVRSVPKGEMAKARLEKEFESADVTIEQVDMADFDSIEAFAGRLNSTIKKLDVAILNAGVYSTTFAKSKYGYDQHLQTNVLGNTLLSLLLLPQLERAGELEGKPARLMVVGSETHAFANWKKASCPDAFEYQTKQLEEGKSRQGYQTSKLFLLLLQRELAVRLDTSKVIVGDATPGYCATGLFNELNGFWFARLLERLFARTVHQGANLCLRAAFRETDESFHDGYFAHGKRYKTSQYSRSKGGRAFGAELWEQAMEILNQHLGDRIKIPEAKKDR
ncbi:NAD(P)-binding protein [Thelephora ganbajun]|uniref:NAD(P)-binding protein n=1 Tax=Thelephora ganbajun TaxID=370292 RepID=A0ACB6ZXX3_THEGA|nr:NAD(P)-binding protein [Thelephora ganbajun]